MEEGDSVVPGQAIANIEDKDFQLKLERTRHEAEAARAALQALKKGTRPQELKVAEAEVEKAQAQVRFTEAEIKRIAVLVADKMAPDEALEKAQLAFEHALATEDALKHRLTLLQEGPRQEEIQQAAAKHKALLTAVALAERQVSKTRLRSPVAGYVTVKVKEAGELVAPGQPVVKIAELGKPWVRAYLAEPYLARVKLGQQLRVRVDGLDKEFTGRLVYLSPKAEFTPKTVETRELRVDLVYRIKVALENPKGELKIGMPADIILPMPTS